MELNENEYFVQEQGFFPGHGEGFLIIYRNDQEDLQKWVFFRDAVSNRVEIIDPDLYELYLDVGNQEIY